MKKHSPYFKRNFASIFLGGLGSQAMYVLMANYTTIFFTDFLGIGAGVAGTIFMLSRIWDGINDPICGVWIEKSNPRFGKIPTFITIGGILAGISLVLLFTVPNFSTMGRTVWGAVAYNLYGMAFTAVTVATLLQMARGTREAKERVSLSMSYTVSCAVAGIGMAALITKIMTTFAASDPTKGYQRAAVYSAVIGIIGLIISAVLFRDQESELEQQAETKEKTRVIDMIRGVVKVPSFLALVSGVCISNVGYGILAADLMYYLTYVMEKPEVMGLLLPAMYIGLFGGSLIAPFLTRFGKKTGMESGMVLMVISAAVIRIFEGNVVALVAGYFLMAASSAILTTFLQPALVDCAEYTEYKTGIKCQALAMTGFTFVSKMTAGLSAAILGFALQIARYDGTAAAQTESAVDMIRNMMFLPVVIASMVGFVILFFLYKLDEKKMKQVRDALQERSAGHQE